jgi:hypothetical protein
MKSQNDALFDAFESQVLLNPDEIKGGKVEYTSKWVSSSGVFLEAIYSDGSKKYFNVIGREVSADYLISHGDNNIA